MDALNADCLNRIFAHVDDLRHKVRCLELVCGQWCELLRQPAAHTRTRQLDASDYVRKTRRGLYRQADERFEAVMEQLLTRCGPSLRRLSFGSKWLCLNRCVLALIGTHCRQLIHLDLGCVVLSAPLSPLLGQIASQLELFSLEETTWANGWDGGEKFSSHFPAMRRLKRLNLRRYAYPLDSLISLASEELETVDLSGAKYLPLHVLTEFLHTHPNLKELVLCPFPYNKGAMGRRRDSDLAPLATVGGGASIHAVIDAIGASQKQLKTLTLGFLLEGEGRLSLAPLGGLRDTLRHLQLQDCPCLDSAQLNAIIDRTHELRSLSLVKCPLVDSHAAVATQCPSLNHLDITANPQFSSADLVAIADGCPLLKRLRLEGCPAVGNSGVWRVVEKLSLKELELVGCEGVSEELFASADEEGPWAKLEGLEVLSLNACSNITNRSISELAATSCLTTLKQLDVSHNMNIDDSTVLGLAERIGDLRGAGKRSKAKTLLMYVFQTGITKKHESIINGVELMF